MRMRKKKHGAERIEACSELLIKTLPVTRDGAAADFGRGGELRLEIGCGKGAFIRGTAVKEPDVNFIALERCSD
ncbi:MAG: tRNA (guanosine(46)-N7)-methyltransferase TrmB, partial [Eubacteriales bacterium]